MTGRCWRLLAIFSLIVLLTPLFGQIAAEGRSSTPGGRAIDIDIVPRLDWKPPLAFPPILTPERSFRPILPRPAPVLPGALGLQQNLFQQLVRSAGIIFSGRVISVETLSATGSGHSATAITFQIEHAMLGIAGTTFTLHEWGGLWERGERYRVGERVLLLLYAPSKLGFTSPVGGTLGRFAINSQDQMLLSEVDSALWLRTSAAGRKAIVAYSDFARAVQQIRGTEPR